MQTTEGKGGGGHAAQRTDAVIDSCTRNCTLLLTGVTPIHSKIKNIFEIKKNVK